MIAGHGPGGKMKINPVSNPNILKAYQSVKPVAGKTKIASGRDEVIFSEEALSFAKAMEEARDTLEFRTPEEKAHIADVTAAVRRGDYSVSSDKIADRILESVLRR